MSAYDDLSPRALWYLENFGELDLADICAVQESRSNAVRALHSPVTHLSQVWCGECSVRRRTGPTTEEWVAYIPHPCRTIQALDGEA